MAATFSPATALRRHATRWRNSWPLWPVLLAMGPLVPGLLVVLAPVLDITVWRNLAQEPRLPQALLGTLLSATLGTLLATALALRLAVALHPGARWHALVRRLPLPLALPHAAFAVGLLFLLSPSGWLARVLAWPLQWAEPPAWVTVQDPFGLSLALALALKEAAFLLWVLAAVLADPGLARQARAARTLGYGPQQVWRQVLWPQVLPRLGWPLVAIWAYGLSVVDMALVLGPTHPPTLAVLAWRWLSDPDPAQQALGMAAALWLAVALLAGVALVAWLRRHRVPPCPDGVRRPVPAASARTAHALLLGAPLLVLAVLLLWSLSGGWFFPALWPDSLTLAHWRSADLRPLLTTTWLGVASTLLCLPAVLLWLEWGPRRLDAVLYLPLILPALPLAAGQYGALLASGSDGTVTGLVWSHLLWVLPYMLLVLAGPYRAFDARLMTSARTLGQSRLRACLRVKWPLLLRPVLAALAVGFAVSVAQYLPTQFAGGGRFATVTTEAVALSAGGDRRVLAVQALLQAVLPLLAFVLAAAAARLAARRRAAWR